MLRRLLATNLPSISLGRYEFEKRVEQLYQINREREFPSNAVLIQLIAEHLGATNTRCQKCKVKVMSGGHVVGYVLAYELRGHSRGYTKVILENE